MRSTTALPPKVDIKDAWLLVQEVAASGDVIDARVVIERDGVAVGAFVPIEDIERLIKSDEQEFVMDMRIIDDIRAGFADVPPEEIEREIEKALAEVDAERATRRARGVVV